MTRNKRISIIIPAYNEERYLARCLDSVAAQVQKPYEVIVVNNGSTDKTAAIARRYPFVTLLDEPQRGRASAQTAGFNAATGDILARTDADAILPADWTARIADYFARPEADKTAWASGALFYNVRFTRLVSYLYGWVGFSLNRLLTGHPSLWGSSMAFPRAAWQTVASEMCMQPDLHEDLDLSIHLHQHGYAVVPDRHTKVGVEFRPAYASPHKVWEYLQLWPRTLRIHNRWQWVLCWPVNILVFINMPFFGISERIARFFGRKRLND